MKGMWNALVLVGLLSMVAPSAFAASARQLPSGSSGTFETTVIQANTASAGSFGPTDILYGFKIVADTAGDVCGLYDTALLSTATLTQGIFIDELTEDTDERIQESDWPGPYKLVTDLTVITNAANQGGCVIYHDPK